MAGRSIKSVEFLWPCTVSLDDLFSDSLRNNGHGPALRILAAPGCSPPFPCNPPMLIVSRTSSHHSLLPRQNASFASNRSAVGRSEINTKRHIYRIPFTVLFRIVSGGEIVSTYSRCTGSKWITALTTNITVTLHMVLKSRHTTHGQSLMGSKAALLLLSLRRWTERSIWFKCGHLNYKNRICGRIRGVAAGSWLLVVCDSGKCLYLSLQYMSPSNNWQA
jgi:hypothetical protein